MITNEELILKISELENEISDLKRRRNYGLVWENHSEKLEQLYQNHLPILTLDETKKSKFTFESNKVNQLLIEADNLEALLALQLTHKNKIDLIYIDPPYNTGEEGWIYNDNIVDINDSYRHSKWLSFMERRLKLALILLKEDGVIFISIDDSEYAQLKLLCDLIFNEENFINNFMWLHGKGKKNKQSRTLQQHTLCYAKNIKTLNEWSEISDNSDYKFTNIDGDPKGEWFSGSISFNEGRSNPKHKNYFTVTSPSKIEWTRQWQKSQEEIEALIMNNDIYFGEAPEYKNVPREKIRPQETEIIPVNLLSKCGTTKDAKNELKKLQLPDFEYPKPSKLIEHLIKITNKANDITILDFFAGSGTTGQAVMALNKEDSGNRKFILCTNNEKNICEDITYKRVLKTNINKDNIYYLKPHNISGDYSKNLKNYALHLIMLNENCFNLVENNNDISILEVNGLKIALIHNTDNLNDLIKKTILNNKIHKFYFYSESNYLFNDIELLLSENSIKYELIPTDQIDNYIYAIGQINNKNNI